jgi:hypothetical protein
MATNRTPISRPRVPSLTPEIIALFTELENAPRPTPRGWRKTQEFTRKSQRLASLLGLSDEWWMMLHVETANAPRPHPTLAAHALWPRVQAIRAALLEALRTREARPAEEAAEHPVSEAP